MADDEPLPLPDNDSIMLAANLRLSFIAPRTLRGAIGMALLELVKRCGVEPQLEVAGTAQERFGDLPQPVRDSMVADILTSPNGNAIIRRRQPNDPQE